MTPAETRVGGTAACVFAGPVLQSEPELSILLIEQGRDNFNDPAVTTPATCISQLAPDTPSATFYKAKASDHFGGRELVVPSGAILGGGSSIDFVMYTRAQGVVDYDAFKTPGWTQKNLLRY